MLRRTIKTLQALVKLLLAYEYHRRADAAVKQLRLHSDAQLKDMGINKGAIYEAAHRGCGWCNRSGA